MAYCDTKLTKTEIDTILKFITEKVSEHLGKPFVLSSDEHGLSYIKYNDVFLCMYPPKGYLDNTEIQPGWICLQNIFRGQDDLLEMNVLSRSITMGNYNDMVEKILNIL